MAFAVGRVLSWGGFLGFLGLFSIFVVKRWLVGVMVRGVVKPERRKKAYGMTGCREEVMPKREKWRMA